MMFRVWLDNADKEVLCYAAGKFKKGTLRLFEGERVEIDLDPYTLDKGRIVKFEKKTSSHTHNYKQKKRRKK